MPRNLVRWITSGVCLVAFFFFPLTISAQYKEIDRLGEDVLRASLETGPEPKIIAVADLYNASGGSSGLGHYFSLLITWAVHSRLKSGYGVADNNALDSALKKLSISPNALTSPQSVIDLVGKINMNIVVIGDFRRESGDYILQISTVHIPGGAILNSTSVKIRRTEFFDYLDHPFPPPEIASEIVIVKKPGELSTNDSEVHPPVCLRCPVPEYSSAARAAKIQGSISFDTVISKEGRIEALRPRNVLGLGLEEAAYKAIKNWRFRPGTGKSNQPLVVLVPIEVTFRLY